MTVLLDNVSADVSDPPAGDIFTSKGGPAVINVRGDNFGGGTVTIQNKTPNDSRFAAVTNGTFTADGSLVLDLLPNNTEIRAILSGSTTPSNVFADITI